MKGSYKEETHIFKESILIHDHNLLWYYEYAIQLRKVLIWRKPKPQLQNLEQMPHTGQTLLSITASFA